MVHWQLDGKVSAPLKVDYLLVSVIGGTGELTVNGQTYPLKKGDNFILPAPVEAYDLTGQLEIVVSHE